MQVVPVEEQPAPVSGVVVGVVTEQPGASSGGAARGSLESLGRWNEKGDDRAMPVKLKAERDTETMVRRAFGKFVDELVQTKGASSGILAISNWKEMRGPHEVTVSEVSWSASPDDTSYQRHGAPEEAARLRAEAARLRAEAKKGKEPLKIRFADFEGAVDDLGNRWQIAVYRVTLPSRGLDPDKWVGRPPPPAPEELYTGPRRDGLLSTDEISGDYFAPCVAPFCFCNSMTVVPLGADTIETWRTGCVFFPPLIGPGAGAEVRTRKPGTNAFDGMTFSARGTASGGYKKRPGSQKRTFQKVETRDLAGKWRGCCCIPYVLYWPFLPVCWTTKKALNEDQYEEKGCFFCSLLPLPLCPFSETRTRHYEKGHPTNWFDHHMGEGTDVLGHIYRDSGCVHGAIMVPAIKNSRNPGER